MLAFFTLSSAKRSDLAAGPTCSARTAPRYGEAPPMIWSRRTFEVHPGCTSEGSVAVRRPDLSRGHSGSRAPKPATHARLVSKVRGGRDGGSSVLVSSRSTRISGSHLTSNKKRLPTKLLTRPSAAGPHSAASSTTPRSKVPTGSKRRSSRRPALPRSTTPTASSTRSPAP